MPLETRLSKVNFAGQDGFSWFIGQVTSDAAWREHSEKWGYRVKVRIFGKHPPSTELPDADLPWAHVLVPATFGAGKAFAGTTMMLQGGETVSGYFLDGEEAQQPVIIGCFHTSNSVLNQVNRTDEPEGSSEFLEMFPPPNFDWSTANTPNGGVDNGNGTFDNGTNSTLQQDSLTEQYEYEYGQNPWLSTDNRGPAQLDLDGNQGPAFDNGVDSTLQTLVFGVLIAYILDDREMIRGAWRGMLYGILLILLLYFAVLGRSHQGFIVTLRFFGAPFAT